VRRDDKRLNRAVYWIWFGVAIIAFGTAFLLVLSPQKAPQHGIRGIRPILFPAPEKMPMSCENAKKRLTIDPNDANALVSVMVYYQNQGRWRDSMVYARRIVAKHPQEVLGYLGLVYALQNCGATEEAIKVAYWALQHPFKGVERGQILRVLGDLRLTLHEKNHDNHTLNLAEQHYREAHALGAPLAMLGMARVAIERGQYSVARYYLTQIYSRSPYPRERALAAYYLGYLAEQMGDFRTSRYWYDIAKRIHSRSFI